jgi:hypothetical protein
MSRNDIEDVFEGPEYERVHRVLGQIEVLDAVSSEMLNQRKLFPKPANSLHEAYAVLLEEVDEVWDIVRQKKSARDPAKLAAELVQIAAYASRMIIDLNLVEHLPATEEESNT